MNSNISIRIDGDDFEVESGITVAAALINAGLWRFRDDAEGGPRAPICAMGICFECRVTVDGCRHQRACMTVCRSGMEVQTGG